MKKNIAVCVGVIFFNTACTSSSPSSTSQPKDELGRTVAALAAKYNADADWMKLLEHDDVYTIELQEALLQPPNRHHIVLASIVDVFKKSDSYFLTAAHWSGPYFQLECSVDQVKYIRAQATQGNREYQEFAIVMTVASVHRPVAQLASEVSADEAVVVHEASSIVIIRGRCTDLFFIGDTMLAAEDIRLTKNGQSK